LPEPETVSLDRHRTQKDQQAELNAATRQLMESLVRTFQAQQALDSKERSE
jgi:hypothetical protein